jgi:hypothetical protein
MFFAYRLKPSLIWRRFFLPKKAKYNDLYNIPYLVYSEIINDGDLTRLGGDTLQNIIAWRKIQGQAVKDFGINSELLHVIRLKKQYINAVVSFTDGKKFAENEMRRISVELDEIYDRQAKSKGQKRPGIIDIIQLGGAMGHQIPATISAGEFFGYLKVLNTKKTNK